MDKKIYEDRVKRLQEVNKVVKSLEPEIRESSFNLLKSYVIGQEIDDAEEEKGGEKIKDKGSFFSQFSHDKPSDNVFYLEAYFYSQYGTAPIALNEIQQLANEVGLTVPNRINMTLRAAKRDGKSLFTSTGTGKFKPTVYGEKFLRDTYKATKGAKKKEENKE